ncbi:glycoside hydrolase family 43 protein [Serpula lacrymans var. lacrymans S7.3]|uniref:Glycoside hydrolase family 43 protein n=2 Tax=Serpula lacrymans var. lacrymans TaxID=341189 RepID=F8PMD8_SERL3|nr:glycoside hydrolase family 43 protein [Serpula lacrymans var. lacrymans S7.9]EGO02770.1 glycoside hydrolase family 43 protein [Serpula lacrymans var. lacrymans S7.3]EGO28471.1 glycoside hydrolase family 43 protein [Serpula lacrymans var. lacrymans S7.9]
MRPSLGFGTVTLGILLSLTRAENVIVPGAAWTDTNGNVIQAHGTGLLKVDNTFYWFGEDKTDNSALFEAVPCYSSTDLLNWERQNDALTPVNGTMISAADIVERPKVIYNKKNSEYVMWFHSDNSDYSAAMVGVATSETPCGPYDYKASWKPLGADSRDESIFQDADQTAYLLYASDNNVDFKISVLDSNYYNVTAMVSEIPNSNLEAPGIVKRNNTYYLIASHTSGWAPNPNKWFSAPTLSSNWSSQNDIAPEDTNTYFSQNAYDLPLGNNTIYMGDRWWPELLGNSSYIWLPLDWSSGAPQLVWADVWSIDLEQGTYSVATGTTYIAEDGVLGGTAEILNNSAVGWLGNGGTLTLSNIQGNGAGQWVSLYYANADSTWRNTTVSVNGGPSVSVNQPNTGGVDVFLSVPVKLYLEEGANSLLIAANQSSYAGDLEKIIVYNEG